MCIENALKPAAIGGRAPPARFAAVFFAFFAVDFFALARLAMKHLQGSNGEMPKTVAPSGVQPECEGLSMHPEVVHVKSTTERDKLSPAILLLLPIVHRGCQRPHLDCPG
jgi:hypothetical protein